jgi:hypothetical protein
MLGLALGGEYLTAATKTWTGAAGNGLWSDAGNWAGGVPVNGDTIVYSTAGGGNSFGNLTLSLASFRFAPAILPEHNFHLTAGASLTLTGFGIDNVSRIPGFGQPQIPPGVIRQQLFMDAGSTMTFQNAATIGGGDPVFNLPVDLNALGGTTVGGSGGRIIFEHNSTASGPPAYTFTGLRIYGAVVAGAGGGELIFRDDASMGFTAGFAVTPGRLRERRVGRQSLREIRSLPRDRIQIPPAQASAGGSFFARTPRLRVASRSTTTAQSRWRPAMRR